MAPLLLLAYLPLAALSPLGSAASPPTTQADATGSSEIDPGPPNIVFIIVDQMRADFLGCVGNEAVHSPHLDRFAKEGARFARAYASTPSCTPARAAILTGQSPWSHGMIGYGQIAERYPIELPRLMNEAGYHTYAIGKQHFHPQRNTHGYQGMELDEGGRRRDPGFVSDYHLWFEKASGGKDPNATGLGWNDYRGKAYHWAEELHPTAWTGDRAVKYLREYDLDQPLFLKVSFFRPHSPYDPPASFLDKVNLESVPSAVVGEWSEAKFGRFHEPEKFTAPRNNLGDEITRTSRAAYAASISFIDKQVGRIVDELKSRSMLNNTLLIFTSDHGDMLGDHHLWRKTYAYEGSAGIPMLMYWGDNVMRAPRGQLRNELVELRDLLPTFLDAAGAAVPEEVEGLSMLYPVKGLRTAWRSWLDLEHSTCYWPGNNWTALVDARWKYIFHAHDGSEQLFDLHADPQELNDLATDPQYASELASWRGRMAEHLAPRGEEWVKDGAPVIRKRGKARSPNYPKPPQAETEIASPKSVSGIYPHLAFFNDENECGTGALVPWANRLWAVTYAPHAPRGSSDKLYEITPDLDLIVRPESVGGTPANRMIHQESEQLFIGPYAIDKTGKVRVIPYGKMLGRPTGNARHLTDPANKIYYATMEEGLYEVDVHTLEVTELYADNHRSNPGAQSPPQNGPVAPPSNLPGYHGKGLYSGQGRVVYSNNGEKGPDVFTNPFTPSGALAEWKDGEWNVVLRNQFTEVTGPGGIHGNADADNDPIWSIGWDARSLILMMLDQGKWHRYRLPKASHSYDGAHGWNTEWPRIRDIGEDDLLMTMHGMFWRFPRTFSAKNTSGIAPRSTYLKVIGDFCRWQDRIVFGCDDTARSEFNNKRKAKGVIAAPQSQSNLWFVEPEQLDHIGPIFARGAVWLNDQVAANEPSDPMLVNGFQRKSLHLVSDRPVTIHIEADANGDGNWKRYESVQVDGYQWHDLLHFTGSQWLRLRSDQAMEAATAWFQFSNLRNSTEHAVSPFERAETFREMARLYESDAIGGVIRARGGNKRTLHFAARSANAKVGYYELDEDLNLRAVDDDQAWDWLKANAGIPDHLGVLEHDGASLIYIDDSGHRYRLPTLSPNDLPSVSPFNDQNQPGRLGSFRICREVATERDLFHAGGNFYELPANNAGGFAKIRPIASHRMHVYDFCSYRGLLVMSGVNMERARKYSNPHIVLSDDNKAGLWVGAIDDLWKLGKPQGTGMLWPMLEEVQADENSLPFLINGFAQKSMFMRAAEECQITLEIDISGEGDWHEYKSLALEGGKESVLEFPASFHAYWIRARLDRTTRCIVSLSLN